MLVRFFLLLSISKLVLGMSIMNISDNFLLSSRKFLDLESQSFSSALRKVKRVSYYGERCLTHFDCALQNGLTCINSTCTCSSPQYIARLGPIPDREKMTECVLRVDSECGSSLSLKDLRPPLVMRRSFPASLWNKLVKNVPFLNFNEGDRLFGGKCVDNAECIQGSCQCHPDYFKDRRGICIRKHSISQPCEGDHNCRTSEGLQCIGGVCQCKMSMVYDEEERRCLIPVGGSCDAYSSSSIQSDCVRNAECSNSRCTCLDGYIESSGGSCGVSFGKACGTENKCSDIQLTCRSGKCQCRYPIHQEYNETLGLCMSKPDGPCDMEEEYVAHNSSLLFKQNCIPFAECVKKNVQDDSMFEYTCKCQKNYDEDQVGYCVPSYMSICIKDEDCDHVGQLRCVNGNCACPDELLVWDQTRRRCVGVVGARCRVVQIERILSMKMDIPTECVDNAICVEHVPVIDGRCECKEGFYFYKDEMKCVAQI